MIPRCRACGRRMRRPAADGLGPVCRRRLRPSTAAPRLELPPPVPAAAGQLAFDEPATTVPCSEWLASRRLARRIVTVPGPDTWPTADTRPGGTR